MWTPGTPLQDCFGFLATSPLTGVSRPPRLRGMIPRIPAIVIAFLLSSCSAQAGIIVSAWDVSDEAAVLSQWRGFDDEDEQSSPLISQAPDELASVSSPQSGGTHAATLDLVPVPDRSGLQRRLYINSDVRPLPPFLGKPPKPA